MIKEIVCIKQKKTSLTVTNSSISAVLRSNIQKTGIRLYENGCLGIAGAIGAYDENKLTQSARQMLKFKLPYEAMPTADAIGSLDLSGKLTISDTDFVTAAKDILSTLRQRYSQFMFSNKINLIEDQQSLSNDAGTNLVQKDRYLDFTLLIKHRDSRNLYDGYSAVFTRDLNIEMILQEVAKTCEAYAEKADFSEAEEKIPVVMLGGHEFLTKFMTDLEGNTFANNASIFSDQRGEKLFNDEFSLLVKRDAERTYECFFDGEGTVLPQNRFALIENGVLKAPYSSKKVAQKYDLPVTGSAILDYEMAPVATPQGMAVEQSTKTIKQLLAGRKAILAVIAGGGDFTPQGEFASPIQAAYLFDGENYLGRLPQLSMRSTINQMFGQDFIGASSDGSYPGCPYSYLALDMYVRKIDDWL